MNFSIHRSILYWLTRVQLYKWGVHERMTGRHVWAGARVCRNDAVAFPAPDQWLANAKTRTLSVRNWSYKKCTDPAHDLPTESYWARQHLIGVVLALTLWHNRLLAFPAPNQHVFYVRNTNGSHICYAVIKSALKQCEKFCAGESLQNI